MTTLLAVPFTFEAVVHEIEGGGYWGEIPVFPGCVAQADTLDSLRTNLLLAINDWCAETSLKTAGEARQLAAIQGTTKLADETYPQPYDYQPPASWTEEDE